MRSHVNRYWEHGVEYNQPRKIIQEIKTREEIHMGQRADLASHIFAWGRKDNMKSCVGARENNGGRFQEWTHVSVASEQQACCICFPGTFPSSEFPWVPSIEIHIHMGQRDYNNEWNNLMDWEQQWGSFLKLAKLRGGGLEENQDRCRRMCNTPEFDPYELECIM